MKYVSTPVNEGLQKLRLQQIEKAVSYLIDASVQLGAGMHDEQLKKMIDAAYRRASYIQGVLATEVN